MFIDTHAHLYLDAFSEDINAVIQRAKDNKVDKIFLPNIDSSSIDALHILAKNQHGICYPMMGLHPCSVKDNYREELTIIEEMLRENTYYGVGETGIDLYWDKGFRKEQEAAFEQQIAWAIEYELPVIIHSRDSLDLTIEIIEAHKVEELRGIFHCFNGNISQCKRIADVGFMMGLGGVITFKNSGMSDVLSYMPLDNVVLETDAPYLSPTPHRGKRNESSYIPLIAEALANARQMDVEEIEKKTTGNAKMVFGLR